MALLSSSSEPSGSLTEKAYEEIKRFILTGRFRPGQVLLQEELSSILQISRTPVREALSRLYHEGLVQLVPGKGASVCEFSVEDIQEAFEARALLEGYAARSAVQLIADDVLDRLETLIISQQKAIDQNSIDRIFECDTEFHHLIIHSSRNRRIVKIIDGLADQTAVHRVRMMATPSRLCKSLDEHRKILEALRNRDTELVQKLMTEHLLGFCREVLQQWLDGLTLSAF